MPEKLEKKKFVFNFWPLEKTPETATACSSFLRRSEKPSRMLQEDSCKAFEYSRHYHGASYNVSEFSHYLREVSHYCREASHYFKKVGD